MCQESEQATAGAGSAQYDKAQLDVYSGVRWSAASKYGAQAMQFVVSIVLARLLAPEYFGLLGMAVVVTNFAKVFRNLGFGSAIVQRKTIDDRLLSTLFWVNLAMYLLVGGVVAGISPVASWMYSDPRVGPLVAVLSVNFVFGGLTTIPTAILNRQMAFNKLAVREIAAVVINGATALTLALLGWGVWALVAGSLAGAASEMILINLLQPFRPRLAFDASGLKQCLGFGLNLTGFSIFNYFARNADKLIIGIFLGPVAVGYYVLAYRLMLLPRDALSRVVTRVLFPAFSRRQDDNERLANVYLRACGAIAFITFPMMAGLAVVARPFVEVVLGDKWLPAVPLIWILAPVGAFQSLAAVRSQVFLAKGRADWHFRWGVCSSLVTLTSFFVGILWGLHGLALAYCAVTVPLTLASHVLVMQLLPSLTYGRFLRTLAPHAAATALMLAVVSLYQLALRLLPLGELGGMTSSILVGIGVYVLITLVQRPSAVADFKALVVPPLSRLRRHSSAA